MIPLSVPNLSKNDLKNLVETFKSTWISTNGKEITNFENLFKKYVGSKYAVACNSGTSALHIALKVAGLRPNDEVILPSLTFAATANSVIYNQGIPIFFSCDKYLNINIDDVKDFLKHNTIVKNGYTYNKATGRKIFGIIPVHMYGFASDIYKIKSLLKEKKIKIIEDAAESLGTFYSYPINKHTGNFGDIGIFSFNANKIITSGSGGMIVTNNKSYADRARLLINQSKKKEFEYIHSEIGFNYRMNNLCAAIGMSQLSKLNDFLKKKKFITQLYRKLFLNTKNVELIVDPNYSKNNYWMPILKLNVKNNIEKNNIIKILAINKIQVRGCWDPLHSQKPYKNYQNFKIDKLKKLTNRLICLPSSTHITNEEIVYVAKTIKKLF